MDKDRANKFPWIIEAHKVQEDIERHDERLVKANQRLVISENFFPTLNLFKNVQKYRLV